MKTYLASLLAVSVMTASTALKTQAAPSTNRVPLTPSAVTAFAEMMRTNHPTLRAQDARVRASSHASRAVRTWSDPMFAFGGVISDGARGPKLREEGDLVYEVEQPLPLFGKPASTRAVADRETEIELNQAALEFQTLRRDLAKSLFNLAFLDESLAIGHEDVNWLDAMARVTEERYRAGLASQSETLRVQNEHAKRKDALRTESLRRNQARVGVNRLLNRPFAAEIPVFQLPDIAPPIPISSNLLSLAIRNEPRLRVLEAEIQMLEAKTAATRKSRLPDVAGYIESRQYSGDGGFREATLGLKLSLPWFNAGKYRSDLAKDRALADATRLDRENVVLGVTEEIHNLIIEIDAARREALLFKNEIVPRAQVALESAHAAWTNNRGTFNEVMESRRGLLEAQVLLANAVSRQFQSLADLILYCGLGDLEALEAFTEMP